MHVIVKMLLLVVTLISSLACYLIYLEITKQMPPKDKIFSTVNNVQKITFVHEGLKENSFGYLTGTTRSCIGFRKLYSQEETAHYIGAGSVLRTRPEKTKTRYIIRESITENNIDNPSKWTDKWPWKTTISIYDSETHKELANRVLWLNERNVLSHEGTDGWHGSNAALFIRQILNPSIKRVGVTCLVKYPETVFSFNREMTRKKISYADYTKDFDECPRSFTLTRWSDLKTPNWIFDASDPIKNVICQGSDIYVFSWVYPKQLKIDWLSNNGVLKGQFHAPLSYNLLDYGYKISKIISIIKRDNKLFVSRLYAKNQPEKDGIVNADFEINYVINIDLSDKLWPEFQT